MPSYTLSTTNPHMGPFGIYNMNPAEKQEKEGEGGGDVLVFNLLWLADQTTFRTRVLLPWWHHSNVFFSYSGGLPFLHSALSRHSNEYLRSAVNPLLHLTTAMRVLCRSWWPSRPSSNARKYGSAVRMCAWGTHVFCVVLCRQAPSEGTNPTPGAPTELS